MKEPVKRNDKTREAEGAYLVRPLKCEAILLEAFDIALRCSVLFSDIFVSEKSGYNSFRQI